MLHSERFVDAPAAQVHATLLEEGSYLCSARTMYRILAPSGEVRERREQLQHPARSRSHRGCGFRPTAHDTVRLFRRAVRGFGAPRHLITDLGGEFSARAFAQVVRRLGTRQRFAAKDSLKATARLERFWRPLKEKAALYRLHLPLTRDDLEARLEIALLQGAVPAEAFLALEPAHLGAVGPPRARPGEGPRNTPFRIGHLDACSGRFPILTAA